MDPLSVVAGIIAVAQAASSLLGLLNETRHASRDQQQLVTELCDLQALLQRLRFRAQDAQTDDPWFAQIKQLSVSDGPLAQLQQHLQDLVTRLTHKSTADQLKSVITWSHHKSEISGVLARIERTKSLINLALVDDQFALSLATHKEVSALRDQSAIVSSHVDDTLKHNVARWLKVADVSVNHHAAQRKCQSGTGTWLLHNAGYVQWRDGGSPTDSSSCIWVKGKPGSGKTVLCSTAIEDISKCVQSATGSAIAYFYFDFNDSEKQDPMSLARAVLYQLSLHGTFHPLANLYSKCQQGQIQPSDDDLISLLKTVLARIESTYLVVDAIDESCQVEASVSFLADLLQDQSFNIRLLAFSRPETTIRDYMSPIASAVIDLQSDAVHNDISAYVEKMLQTDLRLCKWPTDVKQEIKDVLLLKADGMFRWVFCQIQTVRNCTRLSKLREMLRSLPRSLNETYDRIMRQIEDQGDLEDAIRILQALCFSLRPMDALEVAEMLAVRMDPTPRFVEEDRLIDVDHLVTICSSLVSIQPVRQEALGDDRASDKDICEVRLAHASVREYLLSETSAFMTSFVPDKVHLLLAEISLVYLLHIGEGDISDADWSACDGYPYHEYAAKYWWRHARCANFQRSPAFWDLVAALLDDGQRMYVWLVLGDPDEIKWRFLHVDRGIKSMCSSLYYASSTGLSDVVEMLLERKPNVNTRGVGRGTALKAAISTGSLDTVQILLDNDADVNLPNFAGRYKTCLEEAVATRKLDMVQLLLDHRADVNPSDVTWPWASALYVAASNGDIEIVHVLLDHGANVNLQGHNPLYAACESGHYDVAKLLLDSGADVNAKDKQGNTSLLIALDKHHLDIAWLLIDHGADVNAKDKQGNTSLLMALDGHHFDIAWLLIDHGADVSEKGYSTPLVVACACDANDLIEYFLQAGVDVNDCGRRRSALAQAAMRGSKDLVQTLLDHGAGVNFVPTEGERSPLHYATEYQHESVVRLLLEHGADIDQRCHYYGRTLNIALEKAPVSMIQLLIDHGARLDSDVETMTVAFDLAVERCNTEILETLLKRSTSFDVEIGPLLGPALISAIWEGSPISILKLLVDHGAEVNAHHGRPLRMAIYSQRKPTVEFLLDNGALVNLSDHRNPSPLVLARGEKCLDIVQLLESRGATASI